MITHRWFYITLPSGARKLICVRSAAELTDIVHAHGLPLNSGQLFTIWNHTVTEAPQPYLSEVQA